MRMWARVWLDSASVTAAKQGLDTTNKHFRKHDRGPFVRSWDDQALIGNGEARAAHYFSPFYGMCSCIRLEDEHFASWTNILDISHCFQAYKNHCSSYWISNNGFDRGIIVHTFSITENFGSNIFNVLLYYCFWQPFMRRWWGFSGFEIKDGARNIPWSAIKPPWRMIRWLMLSSWPPAMKMQVSHTFKIAITHIFSVSAYHKQVQR